ncbi:hypothetical protein PQ459_14005 [Chryseobacterium sp. KACC 21268]|nr:hypothetical protein PQ459_14005 [Chryseobacterium sp. KACC 21268]
MEIYSANSHFIGDETVVIEFIIEVYGGYEVFAIRTNKFEEYKEISKFAWNKKYDKLYELLEDDLRDGIYETISNSE